MATFQIFMSVCIGICVLSMAGALAYGAVTFWQDGERVPAAVFFVLAVVVMAVFGGMAVRVIWG